LYLLIIEVSLITFFSGILTFYYYYLEMKTGGFGLDLIWRHIGICLAAVRILKTRVQ